MDCEQLVRLIKEWGLQVKQETMAIARMKLFVDQHVKKCPVCAKDLIMPDELEKIYEYLVPGAGRSLVPPPAEPAEDDPGDEDVETPDDEEAGDFADEADEEDLDGEEPDGPEDEDDEV